MSIDERPPTHGGWCRCTGDGCPVCAFFQAIPPSEPDPIEYLDIALIEPDPIEFPRRWILPDLEPIARALRQQWVANMRMIGFEIIDDPTVTERRIPLPVLIEDPALVLPDADASVLESRVPAAVFDPYAGCAIVALHNHTAGQDCDPDQCTEYDRRPSTVTDDRPDDQDYQGDRPLSDLPFLTRDTERLEARYPERGVASDVESGTFYLPSTIEHTIAPVWTDGAPARVGFQERDFPVGVLLDLGESDSYGGRYVLIGHINDTGGLCNDCTHEIEDSDVVRHRFVWTPEPVAETTESENPNG